MLQGRLEAIYICQHKRADLQQVIEVEAVPGIGLVGDRYFIQQGTFSKPGCPDREVTLIEMEAIFLLGQEHTSWPAGSAPRLCTSLGSAVFTILQAPPGDRGEGPARGRG
jgi:hypothetical protein